MLPEADPTSAQVWLARAQGNLALAEGGRLLEGVWLEDLCFNAQQAAEKALKAVCVYHGLDFPKTHSLVSLMDFLMEAGVVIPPASFQADILTQYAVRTRYPGWVEPVTSEEYQEAVRLAQEVISWAAEEIR
jgi:HEPN domain-containing protein